MQQGIVFSIFINLNILLGFHFRQKIKEITPLLAQRSQQRMSCLRQIRLIAPFQNLHLIDNLTPILAARVERKHKHIAMLGNLVQELQIHRRHCRNAEYEQPLRQDRFIQLRQQLFPQGHAVRRRLAAIVQITPQPRLPILIIAQTQQLPSLPRINPIRPVHQILVENIRHLSGKLIIRRCRAVQITFQLQAHVFVFRGRLKRFAAEQIQQTPTHDFRRKRTERRHIGNQFAHQLPRQTGRQAELQIRRHAEFAREKHIQITPHPLALHHYFFLSQYRIQGRSLMNTRAHFGKRFQTVGLIKIKHSRQSKKQLPTL